MLLRIVIGIIILLLIFVVIYFKYQNKTNNVLIINEVKNSTDKEFINILNIKLPVVFTHIGGAFSKLQSLPADKFETAVKKEILEGLQKYFNKFKMYNSIKSTYNINIDGEDTSTIVSYNNNSRLLIYQLIGVKQLLLFQPNKRKYFKEKIDIFNTDLKKYPELLKLKNIEIILYPGQMIYIPYKWLYCWKNINDSVSIEMTSENIFSKIQKIV
jgi:hypothetical protein